MKYVLLVAALSGMLSTAQSQVTFSEHIAPIIYQHCATCHRPGEIGPMSLLTYSEVAAWAPTIKHVTGIKYMPPWQADPDYSRFRSENFLSDQQIQMIADWADAGAPEGDPNLAPPIPTFPTGSQLGTPDLVLSYEQTLVHKGTNTDDYRIIAIPTGLTQDRDVLAVEMRPGNASIVHHALFSWDTTGSARQQDAQTPEYGYTNFGDFGVSGAGNHQFPTYTPGQKAKFFPEGLGQTLPANSDFLLQVHYAPTPVDQTDSSTINIFFADAPVQRQVEQYVMTPFSANVSPTFAIPANEVRTFDGSLTVPFDVSLTSIFPHKHYLGKKWEVYAVHPNGDTTRLIKIPDWDFNWQGYFYFKKFIKLEAGTVIHGLATYDNTVNNPYNPNNPPRFTTWGEGTSDEMYYLAINFVRYQQGDENVVFEDDGVVSGDSNIKLVYPDNKLYPVYPNPVSDQATIGFSLSQADKVSLKLFNLEGQLIRNIAENVPYSAGRHSIDVPVNDLPAGNYVIRLDLPGDWSKTRRITVTK